MEWATTCSNAGINVPLRERKKRNWSIRKFSTRGTELLPSPWMSVAGVLSHAHEADADGWRRFVSPAKPVWECSFGRTERRLNLDQAIKESICFDEFSQLQCPRPEGNKSIQLALNPTDKKPPMIAAVSSFSFLPSLPIDRPPPSSSDTACRQSRPLSALQPPSPPALHSASPRPASPKLPQRASPILGPRESSLVGPRPSLLGSSHCPPPSTSPSCGPRRRRPSGKPSPRISTLDLPNPQLQPSLPSRGPRRAPPSSSLTPSPPPSSPWRMSLRQDPPPEMTRRSANNARGSG